MQTIWNMFTIVSELLNSPLVLSLLGVAAVVTVGYVAFNEGRDYQRDQDEE